MPVDLAPSAVAARYGGSAPVDVIELQVAHRSVRRYLPDEVGGIVSLCLAKELS